MRQKRKRPTRLGTITPLPTVEDAKKERRNRTIDLSKYNIGFEAVKDKKARPQAPSTSKAQNTLYEKYQYKLDKGLLEKFNTRDIMFYFRDTANDNGVKYIIGNPKVDMRNFKLALDRGYTTEEVLAMIEFLFTSGQTYLDKNSLHPGILLTGWCNRIYNDMKLWLDDKFDPNKQAKSKINTLNREWKDTNSEVKSNVGEWD